MAIPRAIIRDHYTGAPAAQILAWVLLVVSIAPLLAPMVGSALAAAFSWRYIFWFMAGTGLLAMLLAATVLTETRPPGTRSTGGAMRILGGYAVLLADRRFVALVLMLSMSQAAFYAYLGGSPFVFMTLYGLEGWEYGLMFGATAAFWAGAAQFAPTAIGRFGPKRILLGCTIVPVIAFGLLLVAVLAGRAGTWSIVAAIVPMFMCSGVLMPTATVTALHPHGAVSGTASALMGTAAFAAGAFASALVGALADGSELPMVAVMTGCLLVALVSALVALASGDDDLDEMR